MFRRCIAVASLMVGALLAPTSFEAGIPRVGAANPALTPLNPARLLDTRPGETTVDGRAQQTGIQAAKTTFELPVTGRGGVPTDAAAVMLNVTAANPAGPGFVTVFPCGIDRPLASNLNYTDTAVANAVLAKIGTGGKVCIYTENATHILADVNAYVPVGASPTPLNPARLLDTRPGGTTVDGQAQQTGYQGGASTFELQVAGRGGVPADATAVMLNVTAANPVGPGFITVHPCGIKRPLASNLNYINTAVPNAVFAKIGIGGKVCIYTHDSTHIIADVNAYVTAGGSPTPLNPARLLDTRPNQYTVDQQAQQTGIQPAKSTFELPVTGRGGVRTDATAVMLNVTAANPVGPGFITVFPCGIDRPLASNVNYTTTAVPNAVLAKIGTAGKVCIYTENTTHIIVDVNANVHAAPPPATCPVTNPTIPVAECAALVALYQSTDGAGWTIRSGWNTSDDPCTWYGVTCTPDGAHVEDVYLFDNRLVGPLPPEIGNLTNLTGLDVRVNRGIIALPPEIGNLSNLTELKLSLTKISQVPAEIGRLTNLTKLDLSDSGLQAIPPEIGSLTNLTDLKLEGNRLVGLPPEIGKLTNLKRLDVSHNRLAALPPEITNLTNLDSLHLYSNQLSGDITGVINPLRLANLTVVQLGHNGCLTTTDSALEAWLNSVDLYWKDGC